MKQIDVCEAKFSGRVSCSAKYSRTDLGMKLKRHKTTNKFRHFCRYSPKEINSVNDKAADDLTAPPVFGPEIIVNPLTTIGGNGH